jgi:hypothetical protein
MFGKNMPRYTISGTGLYTKTIATYNTKNYDVLTFKASTGSGINTLIINTDICGVLMLLVGGGGYGGIGSFGDLGGGGAGEVKYVTLDLPKNNEYTIETAKKNEGFRIIDSGSVNFPAANLNQIFVINITTYTPYPSTYLLKIRCCLAICSSDFTYKRIVEIVSFGTGTGTTGTYNVILRSNLSIASPITGGKILIIGMKGYSSSITNNYTNDKIVALGGGVPAPDYITSLNIDITTMRSLFIDGGCGAGQRLGYVGNGISGECTIPYTNLICNVFNGGIRSASTTDSIFSGGGGGAGSNGFNSDSTKTGNGGNEYIWPVNNVGYGGGGGANGSTSLGGGSSGGRGAYYGGGSFYRLPGDGKNDFGGGGGAANIPNGYGNSSGNGASGSVTIYIPK